MAKSVNQPSRQYWMVREIDLKNQTFYDAAALAPKK
jgi:hypothetical protein